MSKLKKKWFENFLLSNLNDANISSTGVDQVLYYNTEWKNGDTSNVLLLTPNFLSRDLIVPGSKTGIMNSFRANGFRVRVNAGARLRII